MRLISQGHVFVIVGEVTERERGKIRARKIESGVTKIAKRR